MQGSASHATVRLQSPSLDGFCFGQSRCIKCLLQLRWIESCRCRKGGVPLRRIQVFKGLRRQKVDQLLTNMLIARSVEKLVNI